MEQAEKELRAQIYQTSNKKGFNNKRRSYINEEEKEEKNKFEEVLSLYQTNDLTHKKSIIQSYTNPDKNKIFELANDIKHLKVKDIDQLQTSINKILNNKVSKYLEIISRREKIQNFLKNKLENCNNLQNQICQEEKLIEKYTEEAKEYARKIEEKKEKENREYLLLKDQLESIKCQQLKVEKEKNDIQLEFDEKTNIFLKKEEELEKYKKKNEDLSEKIKYYNEIIKYQNQLHNDIQPYKNQMNNEYQEAKGNIRVFCRIRPPLKREINKKQIDIEYRGDNSLIIKGEKKASNIGREGSQQDIEQFQFNRIFKQEDSQEEIFEEVSPLIQSSLDGYNINIFAYGQTGSGKTYTMEGEMSSREKYGIVPRSVDRIFTYYEEELKSIGWEIKFHLSVCEIYNKKTRDLIGEKNIDKTDELKNIEIHNLKEWNENFVQIGQRRKVAETKMNMESSRSHLIFKINIHLHNSNGMEDDRFGSLNLIDLAGSERVDKNSVSEERFKESIEINSSLMHLKSVFEAMKSKHDKFVPFHNTPLTDVLKDCLSGDNSKTLMFVNISPLLDSFKESTCSLKFATDVNKCYVSGKDDDNDDKNYEGMDLEE